MKRFTTSAFFIHVLGWCLFLLAPVILSPGPLFHKVTPPEMISLGVRTLMLMVYFYGNLFYLAPVVLKKRGVVPYVMLTLLLIVMISYFNSSFHHIYTNEGFGHPPPPPDWRGADHMRPFEDRPPPILFASRSFASLLITSLVAIVSMLLFFAEELAQAKAARQEQELQRVAAELTALKLQISPHFLFNTLNNIRWLVRSKSEMAEDAVVRLSQLLRYILFQSEKEKVDLEPELNHLRDFVELQKIRIENPEAIQFTVEGNLTDRQIVPLLLLPLIENFFKHGDFSSGYTNGIQIQLSGASLIFKTENKRNTAAEKTGIGLGNVIKRLNLHYKDHHVIHFFEKDDVFFLTLELIL